MSVSSLLMKREENKDNNGRFKKIKLYVGEILLHTI